MTNIFIDPNNELRELLTSIKNVNLVEDLDDVVKLNEKGEDVIHFSYDTFCPRSLAVLFSEDIGIHRFSKRSQHLVLKKLGVNTPTSFFLLEDSKNVSNVINWFPYAAFDAKIDNVVCKADNGARGLGQALLKKENIYEFFNIGLDKDITIEDKFKILAPIVKFGGTEVIDKEKLEYGYIFNALADGKYMLQEQIDIAKEYRVLVFSNGNTMTYRRKGTSDHWQKNLSVNGEREWRVFR
jgi:hypothetical protein